MLTEGAGEKERTVSARSARDFEEKEKTEDRTERELERRTREKKWQTCWCCQNQWRVCRMTQISAEKLEQTRPAEKERVASMPQSEQLTVSPELSCQKEKKWSHLCRSSDCEVGESQSEQSHNLATKRAIKAEAWRGKSGLHNGGKRVLKRRGRASKESLSSRRRSKHERMSGRRSCPGESEEFWFHFKSGQI